MEISTRAEVITLYPDVPEAAVDHVLWCLHRAAVALRTGDLRRAGAGLGRDMCAFPGRVADLHTLSVPRIFDAIEHGDRLHLVAELARLGFASDGPAPSALTRYIVTGGLLEARTWGYTRSIDYRNIIGMSRFGDPSRLRGLDPHTCAIVHLRPEPVEPPLAAALRLLQLQGAAVLPCGWFPGGSLQPGPPAARPAGR